MKEIFTISTGANVATAKPSTKEHKGESSTKTEDNDFFSVVLNHIKESIKTQKEDTQILLQTSEEKEDIKIDLDNDTKKKSLENHLLDNLLKIVSLLKNPDEKASSFPSFSNKLEKLINNKTTIKELKNISNITDLLKLSKKYDLGLEKISVKKLDLETIKKEFPMLDKKEFFTIPKEKTIKILENIIQKETTKPIVLSINTIDKTKTKTNTQKEPTIFEKIMRMPKEINKKEDIQVINKIDKEQASLKTTVNSEEKTIKNEIPKVIASKDEMTKVVMSKDEIPKAVINKDENSYKKSEKEKYTRLNSIKIDQDSTKKGIVETIIQNIKTQSKKPITSTPINIKVTNNKAKEINNNEIKTETTHNMQDIKPHTKTDTLASKQLNPTKNTFNNFVSDFKEKIEVYKPPIMKVQLALTPRGLGEVDVTIVTRGNNLHVNISSNTNTMALFTQNQAEFKNSLVNMGFTNLEMNFSNQKENRDQQNGKSSKESSDFFEDENLEEETTSVELVVPRYI